MKRIAVLVACLGVGIGVGYLLFGSKSPATVVVSQSVSAKAKTVTPVTKKNNQPAGDLYVTGGIEAIGFGDSYISQPESFKTGGHVAAGNQNDSNNENTSKK